MSRLLAIVVLGIIPMLVGAYSSSEPPAVQLHFSVAGGALPVGFADDYLVSVSLPTALAFTPDGRLLVTTQQGQLFVVNPNQQPHLALDYGDRVCTERERGMTGITVDPDFAANQWICVYYTFDKYGGCDIGTEQVPVNRVARFDLSASNDIDPASEIVIVDNILSFGATHNAGDLKFDDAGLLYITVGDGGRDYRQRSNSSGDNEAARDLNTLLGKILRVSAGGAVPDSNPFTGHDSVPCALTSGTEPGQVCQETYAWGLRNPFRIAFDPNDEHERLFINDTGQSSWEEVSLGVPGADYGWNLREGACQRGSTTDCGSGPAGLTNPLYAYQHDACGAITGSAFVPDGVWPDYLTRTYLCADFLCGQIFALSPGDASDSGSLRPTAATFATTLGPASVTSLMFGPWGDTEALYYSTFAGRGELHRITYAEASQP